ncbi:phosphatidate cytidylyltransferase [Actinoplanes sp. NPDC049681]|uniref:phosphatidate cytidylyltransferase n=1 Tax=Actinoplanes sp. NPDC049681 TaxID=3363905 RepID=UPI0037A8DAF5
MTTAEATRRGPGKRRAGRDGKPVPAKQNGRAGRNLPAAIGVGTGLVLAVLLSMIFWKPAFLGVIALAAGVGIWEMVRALKVTGARPPLVPLLGGGLLMTGLAWYEGPDALQLGLAATLLAALVWRFSEHKAGFRRDLAAAALITVYVPFLLSFGVLLVKPDDGAMRVLCALLAVVLSDTGGYAAGVFFGKHPMAPTISPKKSWEGFAGSLTAAAVGSSLLLYFLLDISFGWGLLFGAVISVAAVVGDLAESMLKRDIGIKDMSNLLPGHGGLMDRLDSILFAVPAAYLLLSLIAPPG